MILSNLNFKMTLRDKSNLVTVKQGELTVVNFGKIGDGSGLLVCIGRPMIFVWVVRYIVK